LQGHRGQAHARGPALDPAGDAIQRVRGQGDAVMREQQYGLLGAEGEVIGSDFGQLSGERRDVTGRRPR